MDNNSTIASVNNTAVELSYAGFWKRFLAGILDFIVVILVNIIFSIPLAIILQLFNYPKGSIENFSYHFWRIADPLWFFLYLMFSESSARQATFGKRVVGIKVTDLLGNRLSLKQSFYRNIAKYILLVIFSPAFILTAFSKTKQSPYDKLTKCLVVKK